MMEVNKKELKKIAYTFHSACNRLMQADFEDYERVLSRFLNVIDDNDLLHDYVLAQGPSTQNAEVEVKGVCDSYGRSIFAVGSSDEEEIRDIYIIAKYIAEKQLPVQTGYVLGYAHSRKYQDCVKAFNERFMMILIRHIEEYLVGLSIDMGLDETVVYNVTFNDGQFIVAEAGASITATNNINRIDEEKLAELIRNIQNECTTIEVTELANLNDNLNELKRELLKPAPNKTIIQKILSGLDGLKYSAEFSAAIVTLIQFVQALNIPTS